MPKVFVQLGTKSYRVSPQTAAALGLKSGQTIDPKTWARIVDRELQYAAAMLRSVLPTDRCRNGMASRPAQCAATRTYRVGG